MALIKKSHLIIFAFVILIFTAFYMASKAGPHPEALAMIIIVYFFVIYVLKKETPEYLTPESYPGSVALPSGPKYGRSTGSESTYRFGNTDLLKLSKYGNMDFSEIDMATQEMPELAGITNPGSGVASNSRIDNSDVIESAITRGVSLYNPDGSSFSPLQADSAGLGIRASGANPLVSNPLSGKQNIDEMIARKAQHTSSINKRALDGAVRATKDLYWINYQEELDENEKRVWWSSEAQDMETDWTPY